MAHLGNIVKSVRDIMRKDAGVDGDAQRISQMVWMIFLKVFDSMEKEREVEDEIYKSPLPERIRWRKWAENPEGITGDDLLDFINNDLFKTLKNLKIDEKTDQRGYVVKQVFEDAYNYMKNGILIRQVINKINEIDFTRAEDRHLSKDMVDIVVTNPPFGGAEETGIENNFPAEFKTRETADLFLVLIMKLLRDGGKCGLVLPDGFLFGEGVKTRIKEKLLSEFNLHTIVRLPNGVFSPYTGIRTNLLFFEKNNKGTKDIWYFEHPLPEGAKTYNKTKPIHHDEFQLEKAWWNNRQDEKFKHLCWKVSEDDILKRGFNL